MTVTVGLYGAYGATVLLVLAALIRAQYKRARRLQPLLCGLDPEPLKGQIEFSPLKKRSDRVGSALRTWSSERAHTDLVVPARPVEPAPMAVTEPKPKPQATNQPLWTKAAVEPAPARDDSGWEDQSGWMPEPEPASQPAASQAERVNEPTAGPAEPVSEPGASQDEFAGQTADAEEDRFTPPAGSRLSQNADYYEILQISPNADAETIHRVYRIMAARFHPDNPSTGSLERFLLLREAYQTLSDPTLRADYDTSRPTWQTETQPIFWQRSFVDGIEGENNRRLGVLSLLYQRRRVNESKPGISVMELERRMAFPREYLNFTLWYLRQKGYVAVQQDNSDYALTSTGVDFVESGSNTNKVIRELLTAGSGGEYIHPLVPPKVVPFPRTATRARVEGSRRILRRKQAGRR